MQGARRILLGTMIALLPALPACGGPSDNTAVQFEAEWQCEVQRQAFEDLDALDQTLARRLDDAGLTRDEYAAFKGRLETSSDLRLEVTDAYDAFCLQT